jgi:hypothetical protein
MSDRTRGLIMVIGPAIGIVATVIEMASDEVTAWNVVQLLLFGLVVVAGLEILQRSGWQGPSPPPSQFEGRGPG